MSDKMSIKKYIVQLLGNISNENTLEKYNLFLVTAFGTISGKFGTESDNNSCVIKSLCDKAFESYKEKYELSSDYTISGNDGYIILKDACITNIQGTKSIFPELIVFFDQIIAASLVAEKTL